MKSHYLWIVCDIYYWLALSVSAATILIEVNRLDYGCNTTLHHMALFALKVDHGVQNASCFCLTHTSSQISQWRNRLRHSDYSNGSNPSTAEIDMQLAPVNRANLYNVIAIDINTAYGNLTIWNFTRTFNRSAQHQFQFSLEPSDYILTCSEHSFVPPLSIPNANDTPQATVSPSQMTTISLTTASKNNYLIPVVVSCVVLVVIVIIIISVMIVWRRKRAKGLDRTTNSPTPRLTDTDLSDNSTQYAYIDLGKLTRKQKPDSDELKPIAAPTCSKNIIYAELDLPTNTNHESNQNMTEYTAAELVTGTIRYVNFTDVGQLNPKSISPDLEEIANVDDAGYAAVGR